MCVTKSQVLPRHKYISYLLVFIFIFIFLLPFLASSPTLDSINKPPLYSVFVMLPAVVYIRNRNRLSHHFLTHTFLIRLLFHTYTLRLPQAPSIEIELHEITHNINKMGWQNVVIPFYLLSFYFCYIR